MFKIQDKQRENESCIDASVLFRFSMQAKWQMGALI